MVAVGGALIVGAIATGRSAFTAVASALALVAAVAAMVKRPPARASGWWLLVLASGVVVSVRMAVLVAPTPVVPSSRVGLGDVGVVVFWSALLPLGLTLVGGRSIKGNLADRLDATIVALGVFLLSWLFLFSGDVSPIGGARVSTVVRLIGMAVVAGILALVLFAVERNTPSFRLLTAAVLCALASAVTTMSQAARSPFSAHRFAELGVWGAAYAVLLGAAVLHASARSPLATRQRDGSRFNACRAVVFAALTLLGPLAWVVAVVPSSFKPKSVTDFGLPVLITALITLLLLWRLSIIAHLADRRAHQLESLQAELLYRATHDPLTGLGNRSELIDQLDALVANRQKTSGHPTLLLLDLDGFKVINDTLGHPVGDELLVGVGRRLTALSPTGSSVIRFGGDEFAILLPDAEECDMLALAEAVRVRLNRPYLTSRGQLSISTSIGVSVVPCTAESPSEVLRDADAALYAAKAAGKNLVKVFDQKIASTPDLAVSPASPNHDRAADVRG